MQKPVKPKKPQIANTQLPHNELVDHYYPMNDYSNTSITFFRDSDLVEEDFYSIHCITLPQLLAFAAEKEIPIEELEMDCESDGNYYAFLHVTHRRKVPDEEFQTQTETYKSNLAAAKIQHQANVAQWRLDLEQYKIDKAAYDLYKAQQKLNSLQN